MFVNKTIKKKNTANKFMSSKFMKNLNVKVDYQTVFKINLKPNCKYENKIQSHLARIEDQQSSRSKYKT